MANDRTDRPMDESEPTRSNEEDITGRADQDDEEFEDLDEDEADEEDAEA